jgi:hypothetical protein
MSELYGGSVEVNGATPCYEEHGGGAPLILITAGSPPALNGSRWSPSSPMAFP